MSINIGRQLKRSGIAQTARDTDSGRVLYRNKFCHMKGMYFGCSVLSILSHGTYIITEK